MQAHRTRRRLEVKSYLVAVAGGHRPALPLVAASQRWPQLRLLLVQAGLLALTAQADSGSVCARSSTAERGEAVQTQPRAVLAVTVAHPALVAVVVAVA